MAHDEAELHTVWDRYLPGHADAIISRYRQPHRHYHGVRHLVFVVRDAVRVFGLVDLDEVDRPAVVAAAFFHDAVYDPMSSRNEEASAALAVTRLTEAGWSNEEAAPVARLVMATKSH